MRVCGSVKKMRSTDKRVEVRPQRVLGELEDYGRQWALGHLEQDALVVSDKLQAVPVGGKG